MDLFMAYLKQHIRGIAVFFLFGAVFCVSFALYRLPVSAVLYPVGLCALLGAGFIVYDFLRVKKKHEELREISKMTSEMITSLPEAESVAEADCRAIIRALQAEIADLSNSASAKFRDMTEYYIMWVHQIKTPITSMRLTLQNEDTPLSRRLSSDLFQIEQYVAMVLAFVRLDTDSADYVFKEHSIDSIVKSAISKFASEFIDRRIRLSYEHTDEKVVTDDKWLFFVVEQVLSNALKYTREGSIKIYMREPKTLCIEDTGIGIAPEDLPRIFEKGYTGYNGRRDKRASGLGLYLCKRICNNLGIKISVKSEVDKGTAVLLDLEQYEMKKE